MQKTFLSSLGAKTNRLVHKTKQQHSQKQALFFSFLSDCSFSSYILAIPSGRFIPNSKAVLAHISFRELGSPQVPPNELVFLYRPDLTWNARFCAVNHFGRCLLNSTYCKFQQILAFLRKIYLLPYLFSKMAYLISIYF